MIDRAPRTGGLPVGARCRAHALRTASPPEQHRALVGDPQILPYVGYLQADGAIALLTCAATGALLAFVLQGPGPIYVLVVGLAQASGAIPLTNALAILAGTSAGAALGMALVAQSNRSTRKLAIPHLAYGIAATLFALATLPVWTGLAEAIIGSETAAVEYGHSVVRVHMSARLAIGFAGSQLAAAALWLAVLPALTARAIRHREAAPPAPPPQSADALALATQRELAKILARQRLVVEIALETSCASERARAADAEEALAEARRQMELHYARLQASRRPPSSSVSNG